MAWLGNRQFALYLGNNSFTFLSRKIALVNTKEIFAHTYTLGSPQTCSKPSSHLCLLYTSCPSLKNDVPDIQKHFVKPQISHGRNKKRSSTQQLDYTNQSSCCLPLLVYATLIVKRKTIFVSGDLRFALHLHIFLGTTKRSMMCHLYTHVHNVFGKYYGYL